MSEKQGESSTSAHPLVMPRVLCKFRGMLVVAEVRMRPDGTAGSCPDCGSKSFREHYGWAECDCGFAYLLSDVQRLIVQREGKSKRQQVSES